MAAPEAVSVLPSPGAVRGAPNTLGPCDGLFRRRFVVSVSEAGVRSIFITLTSLFMGSTTDSLGNHFGIGGVG